MHRQWGGDLIGMTCMPEAKLAREAEMCYALIALATDYDCWRATDSTRPQEGVLQGVLRNLHHATENATRLILEALKLMDGPPVGCACREALKQPYVRLGNRSARDTGAGFISTDTRAIHPERFRDVFLRQSETLAELPAGNRGRELASSLPSL